MIHLGHDREVESNGGFVGGHGQLPDLHLLEGGDAGEAGERADPLLARERLRGSCRGGTGRRT